MSIRLTSSNIDSNILELWNDQSEIQSFEDQEGEELELMQSVVFTITGRHHIITAPTIIKEE